MSQAITFSYAAQDEELANKILMEVLLFSFGISPVNIRRSCLDGDGQFAHNNLSGSHWEVSSPKEIFIALYTPAYLQVTSTGNCMVDATTGYEELPDSTFLLIPEEWPQVGDSPRFIRATKILLSRREEIRFLHGKIREASNAVNESYIRMSQQLNQTGLVAFVSWFKKYNDRYTSLVGVYNVIETRTKCEDRMGEPQEYYKVEITLDKGKIHPNGKEIPLLKIHNFYNLEETQEVEFPVYAQVIGDGIVIHPQTMKGLSIMGAGKLFETGKMMIYFLVEVGEEAEVNVIQCEKVD